jgi:hypothetical protein
VRSELLRDVESVRYAGYRIPHPLEPRLIVKVQTTDSAEERRAESRSRRSGHLHAGAGGAKTTPARAMAAACDRLVAELAAIDKALDTAVSEFRGIEARDGGDGGGRTPRLGAMTPAH